MRDLLYEVSDACKKRTMQRLLRELNKRKWLQRQRPFITAEHARQRLEWARKYHAYIVEDWKKVVWSDEYTVERGKLFSSLILSLFYLLL